MSEYEEEVVERCLESVVACLRQGPMRWRDIRTHMIAIGPDVEPAYQGRLIDSFIWRRVAEELQRRDLAEKQEWWHLKESKPC